MRAIPSALQEKLDSGATTLCRCWVLTRRDGVTQGFTDHDETIQLGEVSCTAGAGLDATEATERLGLQVDGAEISGALSDEALTEVDLAAGRYDAATVETWLVDWSEPSLRVLLVKNVLGEVRRSGAAFTAEVRSLADRLNQESGRLYTAACSADLGDARCTVDLNDPARRGSGAVAVLSGTSVFRVDGLGSFAEGWFTAGRLTFTDGANSGVAIEVKQHRADGENVTIALWQAAPEPIAPGDPFIVTAGCDKGFGTCRDRFGNGANFRGFPHMPGNDFVMSYPSPGGAGSGISDAGRAGGGGGNAA